VLKNVVDFWINYGLEQEITLEATVGVFNKDLARRCCSQKHKKSIYTQSCSNEQQLSKAESGVIHSVKVESSKQHGIDIHA